jgi:MFS family permease
MGSTAATVEVLDRDRVARRALSISNIDGCLYSLMVGVSESYFGAMAVELGHRDNALALLLTVPMLVGSAAQLLAGPLAATLGSGKRLVVLGATCQALSLLGLFFIAEQQVRALWPLLAVETLYYVNALLVGPPWSAWMAALTEGRQRERYFARRSALIQVALLIGFAAAGAWLQRAGLSTEHKLHAFAVLYLCGFGFRVASTGMLALQPDPNSATPTVRQSVAAIRTAADTADFRVASYLAVLMLGSHIAVPFFTPYMLRTLALDYRSYAGLIAIPIIVKALFFPLLHPLSQRWGMRSVLLVSGCIVVILPALWVVFDGVRGLAFVQALSGLGWGGLEYASYQLLLVSARADCRVEFLSLASTMSSSGQLVGGMTGGLLRTDFQVPYKVLFVLSTIGRAAALAVMLSELPARLSREIPRLFMRVISVRAAVGTVDRPIVSDLPPPPARDAGDA